MMTEVDLIQKGSLLATKLSKCPFDIYHLSSERNNCKMGLKKKLKGELNKLILHPDFVLYAARLLANANLPRKVFRS